ncbi:uncharacterized protein LOC114570230 [Perca flavescens]|uniref:uncharacterized protein LOC114570230 n=1 Tax=Perca flavescens TaxID=8167 RepID=UPI00106E5754|nr:uncharacterized protein LOC114570230 [Perca flavescens]
MFSIALKDEVTPETFLPQKLVMGAVTWRIEEEVMTALRTQPSPGNGPPGRPFVPDSVHSAVLQWAHASKMACPPGVARTMALLRRWFRWPAMGDQTRSFVAACPVCAQNKGTNRPSSGLVHPLPIPQRPWSHLALDFVSGLPLSEGNTVVLTVVDRFTMTRHPFPARSLALPFFTWIVTLTCLAVDFTAVHLDQHKTLPPSSPTPCRPTGPHHFHVLFQINTPLYIYLPCPGLRLGFCT